MLESTISEYQLKSMIDVMIKKWMAAKTGDVSERVIRQTHHSGMR